MFSVSYVSVATTGSPTCCRVRSPTRRFSRLLRSSPEPWTSSTDLGELREPVGQGKSRLRLAKQLLDEPSEPGVGVLGGDADHLGGAIEDALAFDGEGQQF